MNSYCDFFNITENEYSTIQYPPYFKLFTSKCFFNVFKFTNEKSKLQR